MRLETPRLSLAFRRDGVEDGAAPWILLHGMFGCADDWAPLAGRWGQTIAIDLLGHGATRRRQPGWSGWDVGALVSELRVALRAAGVARVRLAGYSLGGRLAMRWAVEHPGEVERLVVLAADPGIEESAARAARLAQDHQRAAALRAEGLPAFLTRWYQLPLFGALRAHADYPAMLARRLAGDVDELAGALVALSPGAQPPLAARLATLPLPTLLLSGAHDPRYVARLTTLAARMPNARHVVIPDAAHALLLEAPEAVATHVAP